MRYVWEFKRCVFLRLNIIRCPCDDKEPLTLCEMTTRIVNETPRLYDQAIKRMSLYVLKLLNIKPDFIIQKLQLIMQISEVYRQRQYWEFDRAPLPLSSTLIMMAKRVSALSLERQEDI